jgi:hypothetical protein
LLIELCLSGCFFLSSWPIFAKSRDASTSNNKNKSLAKKICILFFGFSICFLSFSVVGSSLSAATTVYVDTDGTGNYNCDGTNDHIEINKALTYINSLGGGTVYLRGPNTYWIDATLEMGSNTILTGDSSACIKLVPNAGWSAEVPLIKNKSGANRNITIKGFEIDGNSESQSVSRGKGYYNLMYFENCKGVTVTDMHLEWGTGDGLKVKNKPYSYTTSADITFTGNTVYKLGHDALYVLGMNGVTVANNDVFTRTNSAFRLSSSGNAKIYNNIIHSEIGTGGTSTGPGIEIDKSSGYKSENIEIYNNKFHTLNGAAIWIDGEDTDNVIRGKNVYIHHNTMSNVGQYGTNTGYSNAAITIGQFDNTKIENNVIDKGGHAGIKYYQYSGSYKMSSKFTTYVNNNVIKNCNKNVATGVWNYNSANHKFVLTNNCIYNNANGPYTGSNIDHTGDTYTASSESTTISGSTVSNQVDKPPVANAGSDKTATPGSAVSFDGSASTDDKGIAAYSWDFDASNGITSEATSKTATKTYTTAGTYIATLSVTDTNGQKSTDTVNVVVSTAISNLIDNSLTAYDNRLRESAPSTVYSDSTYLDIGKSTSACRDVMWFDLSEYKTTDTVSKATFSLYWYYPAGKTRTSDTVIEIYRPVEWDPKYVSWSNRASGTPWSTPGGNWFDKNGVSQGNTPYASLTLPAGTVPGNKYYEFDVTQLVQEYVSGKNKNTGFFLKAKTESGNYIAFYSSEYSNAAMRPKLTVTTAATTAGSTTVDNVPVANAGADKTATIGSAVSFDGNASTDDIGIASYSWDFDASNGITSEATGKTATKTYATAATYTVTLTVTDTSGQTATDTVNVVVSGTTSTTTNTSTSTAGSVSYSPTYDNGLRTSSPTSVFSTINYIDIGKTTSACRDVMMFDLSAYKTTDTISKATLSLYWYYPAGKTRTSDTVVEVYRPVEWDPKYVTWNNRASGTSWSTAGGNWYDKNGVAQGSTPYASLTFPAKTVPGNKYYEFDVTQLVQEYVSGKNKNTGFFLKAKTESGNYIAFYSSDWSNSAQRPKLTITS